MGSWSIWNWWSIFAFVQHLHLLSQTDDRTSTAHLSPHLWMDYMLKLQGHTSMSKLIGMPWLYFMILAWWFNVLSLSAGSGAPQLQHFATSTILQKWVTCGWHGSLFLGQFWTLNSDFDPKISLTYAIKGLFFCDDAAKITWIEMGWPGIVHDNQVWSNSDVYLSKESISATRSICLVIWHFLHPQLWFLLSKRGIMPTLAKTANTSTQSRRNYGLRANISLGYSRLDFKIYKDTDGYSKQAWLRCNSPDDNVCLNLAQTFDQPCYPSRLDG